MADANDVNDQAVQQDTTAADSSPVENNQPEATEDVKDLWDDKPKDSPEAKAETEGDKPEPTEEEKPEEADETKPEEQPRGKADERKEQLNTEIRTLVAQRNSIRSEVEKLNAQVYQPQTKDELVEQGLTETDAKVEALRQEIELNKFNEQVSEAQLTLRSEAEGVLRDFPMFDPNNKEAFRPEIAAQVDHILASSLITDPNTGQVIGSNVSPYQLYKSFADTYQASSTEGQVKGQQAAQRQLSAVEAPSSATPNRATSKNSLLDLWSQ